MKAVWFSMELPVTLQLNRISNISTITVYAEKYMYVRTTKTTTFVRAKIKAITNFCP